MSVPQPVFLKNYTPPPVLVDRCDLTLRLDPDHTRVKARLACKANPAAGAWTGTWTLDGRGLTTESVVVNDQPADYTLTNTSLTLRDLPERFVLESEVVISPRSNTDLEGLYLSSGVYCTQCEAEGFRRITWFPDRPDVLARFTTTIIAPTSVPVLLSNGNCLAEADLGDGTHFARFEDPFPKPAYLFALVAGTLTALEDEFVTASGRAVRLAIWAAEQDIDKCGFAMDALKRSMTWDEQVYGREYDLDIYHIVAIGDFNMGAMENKGLNVFNTKYVLARPDTATDYDYAGVEAVIAHEYFHNWTGNRITCRDWFQLSLKEGLTVFRDQQFSSDMGSAAVKRISDVRGLRAGQFPEDASPMAHPVRPDSYIEINNFYTATVYQKGAEVVRMQHTLLGPTLWRKAMDLYFERHDGQAVTCDDFVACMEAASGRDLTQFRRWYAQAGTPSVTVERSFADGTLTLTLRQSCPPTRGQPEKLPFHIPLALGLLDAEGRDLIGTQVIDLTEPEQTIRFDGLATEPVPSLLRGFSAPIKLDIRRRPGELAFLLAHDSDPFARWEAGQTLMIEDMLAAIGRDAAPTVSPDLIAACRQTLAGAGQDDAFVAEVLALPSEGYLGELMTIVAVDRIHQVRQAFRRGLAAALVEDWWRVYRARADGAPYRYAAADVGRRSLKGLALAYLGQTGTVEAVAAIADQAQHANNMTDALSALTSLVNLPAGVGDQEIAQGLAAFAERWHTEALVMDKWFSLQALAPRPDTLDRVKSLTRHPSYDPRNPNKIYSLVRAFAGNQAQFHRADGAGYRFLADEVIALDPINPKVAARLVPPLGRFRRFDAGRAALMRTELQRIAARPGLSPDVYEIVAKSLEG
ncbi:MAG: aminopeptidase N [Alphaproteobacteria bacterium]|nr:MAG: aminopeptidase N [Alphaproteobacteria bacterium]